MPYETSVTIPQASERAIAQPSDRARPRAAAAVRLRHFFPWMSVALAFAVLWGFGPSYFFRAFVTSPNRTRTLTLLLHAHGFVNSCWITLLIVQTMLVAKHRTDIHRRLGLVGIALAPFVIAIAFAVGSGGPMRSATWATLDNPFAKFAFLAMGNPGNPLIFGLLFSAAVWQRRHKEFHKRLMLLATLAIMDAPMTRALGSLGWPITVTASGTFRGQGNFWTPGLFQVVGPLGFENLNLLPFFIPLVIYDIVKVGRPHKATLLGGAVLFLFQPFWTFVFARLTS